MAEGAKLHLTGRNFMHTAESKPSRNSFTLTGQHSSQMKVPYQHFLPHQNHVDQSGWLDLNFVPRMVPLLRLAGGSERAELAAADHSENSDDFTGR
jgi:hypothetical protein